MKYTQALTELIDTVHARRVQQHIAIPGFETPVTRDEVATEDTNIAIAANVIGALRQDALYGQDALHGEQWADKIEYGTFDNCREYGLTITVGGWTFNAYEHRNSDNIEIEGTPTDKVQTYGPYGGIDKYDTLFSTGYREHHKAAQALEAAILYVQENPNAERDQVKLAIKAAA